MKGKGEENKKGKWRKKGREREGREGGGWEGKGKVERKRKG